MRFQKIRQLADESAQAIRKQYENQRQQLLLEKNTNDLQKAEFEREIQELKNNNKKFKSQFDKDFAHQLKNYLRQ